MHDDGDVCVGCGRARVLVGTRAASSVAFAVAALALAVVPRRSWLRWRNCCRGSMDRARLGLLDDQWLLGVCQGLRLAGVIVGGDQRRCMTVALLAPAWHVWSTPRPGLTPSPRQSA